MQDFMTVLRELESEGPCSNGSAARIHPFRSAMQYVYSSSNQSMKPTAPDRITAIVFATAPSRGLSLSR